MRTRFQSLLMLSTLRGALHPTPRVRKEECLMPEKTTCVTEKVIGDTLYIIESAVSSTAKETAYDKLKRMILNDTAKFELYKAS